MDFLISSAWAQAEGGQPSPIPSLVMLVVIFALFYFMFIRPQQKRAKEHRNMVAELKKGDEVISNGGVAGTITAIGENFVSLEVADNVEIKIQKQAVATLLPKGSLKKN